MDLNFSAEDAAFRDQVRHFVAEQLPADIRCKVVNAQRLGREDYLRWQRILHARGWGASSWPREFGGTGWSAVQRHLFDEECNALGAPGQIGFGLKMVAPVIMRFGTPEQQRRFLPRIADGSHWWCQGYSEPGAGSDLASLRTRAVRDGDHYVVNGQKTWTTLAQHADWIFCLVRTDPDARKQEGISFLLIDMKSPGITVRPIIGITLGHHLNEVFFENVRVPVDNRIGEENKGWTYAKFLLANERVGNVDIAKLEAYLGQIRRLLDETKEGGTALAEDPLFQRRMAELEVGVATVKALMADQLAAARTNGAPSLMGAAALKLRGTELVQAILQTGLDVLGRHGMVFQRDALHAGWNGELIGPEESADVIYEHLYRRAATIYGGSSEVQKNIIAKGALGL
jgi:alkylation response protein AidB-like acyl-CoA dehydrogenase